MKEVSKLYDVKLKTLQRWVKKGPERKKGKFHFQKKFKVLIVFLYFIYNSDIFM